jgi:hypothetical protein
MGEKRWAKIVNGALIQIGGRTFALIKSVYPLGGSPGAAVSS